MDDNDKNSQEEKKSSSPEKKLQLDLSQALTTDSDDDDEIIELKNEITPPPKEKESEIDLSDLSTAKFSDDESNEETALDINALDMETAEPENVIHQVDELIFEEESESLDDEEIQPLVVEKPFETGGSDDVIEITEFDDISSEDANEMITLADEGEDLEPEEEFLELIDVEEDSLPEEEEDDENVEIEDEIIQFDGLNGEVEDVELEDDLTNSLGIEAGSEMNMLDETSEEEDLDFNIDSKEISKKIDQVDTIFFDETTSHADFADETPSDAGLFEESVSETDDIGSEAEDEYKPLTDINTPEESTQEVSTANLAPEQIEESIERIILQNFSEKIESMVAEVIEKAVSKEIDRLKNILLEDNSSESS